MEFKIGIKINDVLLPRDRNLLNVVMFGLAEPLTYTADKIHKQEVANYIVLALADKVSSIHKKIIEYIIIIPQHDLQTKYCCTPQCMCIHSSHAHGQLCLHELFGM